MIAVQMNSIDEACQIGRFERDLEAMVNSVPDRLCAQSWQRVLLTLLTPFVFYDQMDNLYVFAYLSTYTRIDREYFRDRRNNQIGLKYCGINICIILFIFSFI